MPSDAGHEVEKVAPVAAPAGPGVRDAPVRSVVAALARVPGIEAVALCGSRARGGATPSSDFDLMVFSDRAADMDEAAIEQALRTLGCNVPVSKRTAVVEIEVGGRKIELFLRALQHIEAELERAQQGLFRRQFNPLHTLGFVSTIAVSYIAYCRPLWDPRGRLRSLIGRTAVYPEPLRRRMIETFVKEARLALIHAGKVRSPGDLAYLSGLYSRVCASLTMILYAANARYPIIDKDTHRLAARLPRSPQAYQERTQALFRAAAEGRLEDARRDATRLLAEVLAIAGVGPGRRKRA